GKVAATCPTKFDELKCRLDVILKADKQQTGTELVVQRAFHERIASPKDQSEIDTVTPTRIDLAHMRPRRTTILDPHGHFFHLGDREIHARWELLDPIRREKWNLRKRLQVKESFPGGQCFRASSPQTISQFVILFIRQSA